MCKHLNRYEPLSLQFAKFRAPLLRGGPTQVVFFVSWDDHLSEHDPEFSSPLTILDCPNSFVRIKDPVFN